MSCNPRPDVINSSFLLRAFSNSSAGLVELISFSFSADDVADVGGANSQMVAVQVRLSKDKTQETAWLVVKMNRTEEDAFEHLIRTYQREKGYSGFALVLRLAVVGSLWGDTLFQMLPADL